MTAWDTEDEYATVATKYLPSPSDSSYSGRIKLGHSSNSSRPVSPPSTDLKELSAENDAVKNEGSMIFDPHRITPTLHANFVSEILSLRRALEAKKKQIESLETTLYETRGEHEVFSAGLTSISKENHSLKRKLELVEAGTSTALSELSKDREKAREIASEARRRLEKAQKKIRSQDGEIDRIHALWARDKSSWEEEKRIIERRVHVAENRLKKILEEVASYEVNQTNKQHTESEDDTEVNLVEKNDSDNESIRTRSLTSSVRFSMLSGLAGFGKHKPGGLSLADELNLDEETELGDNADCESVHSVTSSRHSRESKNECLGSSDWTNVFNGNLPRPCSSTQERLLVKRLDSEILEKNDDKEAANLTYIDSSIEHSQPLSANNDMHETESLPLEEVLLSKGHEIDKRCIVDHFHQEDFDFSQSKNTEHSTFSISVRCFSISPTLDHLETPILPHINYPPSLFAVCEQTDMQSKSTQTDGLFRMSPKSTPPPVLIPSIQLHPPLSTPASPNEHFLPQQFRDKGCQVNLSPNLQLRSTSMQTEEIRVDKRLHLLPSCPQNPKVFLNSSSEKNEASCTQRSISRINSPYCFKSPKSVEEENLNDIYDEDTKTHDLELSKGNIVINLDKINSSTLNSNHIDIEQNGSDNECTDCDVSNVSGVSFSQLRYRAKHNSMEKPKRKNKTLFYINEIEENVESTDLKSSINLGNLDVVKARIKQIENLMEARHEKSCTPISTVVTNEPPFPIPARQSSRRPNVNLSLLNDSTNLSSLAQRRSFHRRSRSVYKLRPATALSGILSSKFEENNTQDFNGTPPLTPSPTLDHYNLSTSEFPNSESTGRAQKQGISHEKFHAHTVSKNTFNSIENDSTSSDRVTSVVSAIAHSMIGEWVYKYVRHRKPNGGSESARQMDDSKKVRHKRWIWLAPYDRAVMWSSKEPTSGTALLGKNGRRLIVQTVLDIKDVNPAPKGVSLFHRSILILSPARALKFTATTMERHYTWLTALSFLAHSQNLPEPISPISDSLESKSRSYSLLRKASIRDSIRVSKGGSNFTSKSIAGSNQSSHFTSEINPAVTSEAIGIIENSNSAADAPIVPRYTDRSISHANNSTTANYFLPLYHRRRSNTSPRNLPPTSHKPNQQRFYSNKAFASTIGISNLPCENNEINACNSCTIPSISMHTNYSNSNRRSNINMSNDGNANVTNSEASSPINCNEFDTCGTVRMQAFISLRNSLAGSEFENHQTCSEDMNCKNMNEQLESFEEIQDLKNPLISSRAGSIPGSPYSCTQESLSIEKHQDIGHAHNHSDEISPFPCL
ncbi:putative nuclear migration protein [Erysiphe neolycopersici]|uniref:Putative nuclear migration protein n=1 Tax=Erysiphe neolycopersici TaxID=212602 RepID=A0A420HTV7_9PEZI|nr:putative nuclear migration protein [Erysiphe neolycopersici]